jgi:hypothetical protein
MTFRHALVALLLAGLAVVRPAGAEPGPRKRLVVVVAEGSPVSNLSHSDLKRIFTGVAVVTEGKKLVPFNFPPGTRERTAFDSFALGMSADEVGRFWVDRRVRGQGEPPRALPSSTHMVKVVTRFPGAIGYIAADQLVPGLKALKVGGVGHTEPTYAVVLQ